MRSRTPRSVLFTALLAAVVTVAVLLTVLVVRLSDKNLLDAGSAQEPSSSGAAQQALCGEIECRILGTQQVRDETIELLADNTGNNAKVRITGNGSPIVLDTTITTMGVRLVDDALHCVAASVSACLIRGPYEGGVVGEVLVSRDGDWLGGEKPYFSDAGSIVLSQVTADDVPDLVRVRHDCPAGTTAERCQVSPVYAEAFDLSGQHLGCTKKYTSPAQIRGWPEVKISASELRSCP